MKRIIKNGQKKERKLKWEVTHFFQHARIVHNNHNDENEQPNLLRLIQIAYNA